MDYMQVLEWWSFVFLGAAAYWSGQRVKRVFPDLVAKKWFQRTIVFHAPIVCTLAALLPGFPLPEVIGSEPAAAGLFGLCAGIASSWSYKAFSRLTGRDTKSVDKPAADADAEIVSEPTEK